MHALCKKTPGRGLPGAVLRSPAAPSGVITRITTHQKSPAHPVCNALQGTESSHAVDLSQLPAYFQLERVVEGLSGLLRRLTGVTLEERPLGQGAVQPAGHCAVAAAHADAAHATAEPAYPGGAQQHPA